MIFTPLPTFLRLSLEDLDNMEGKTLKKFNLRNTEYQLNWWMLSTNSMKINKLLQEWQVMQNDHYNKLHNIQWTITSWMLIDYSLFYILLKNISLILETSPLPVKGCKI
jgi:hypothetical protein